MAFYIMKCKSCGMWQVKEVRTGIKGYLSCHRCNKKTKLKLKTSIGLNLRHHGPYGMGWEAQQACSQLNKPESP